MNKECKYFFQELSVKGFIIPCHDVRARINQEQRSLARCKNRKGYLAEYDISVRYAFLYFLGKGYDIHPQRVHVVFRRILEELVRLDYASAKLVVDSRHTFKYHQSDVTKATPILKLARNKIQNDVMKITSPNEL
jgi:hypothetical protein